MPTEMQYRVGKSGANLREEPSVKARILTTLSHGTIVHADPGRTTDGDWLPVVIVRGWIKATVLEAIDKPS